MAAKNQSGQPSYEPLPREDPAAALLSPSEREDRDNGKTPVFRLAFSPIMLLRLMIVPIVITDVVFICMPQASPGSAAAFAMGGIFLVMWHASRVFKSLLPGRKSNKFDLKIGNFSAPLARLRSPHAQAVEPGLIFVLSFITYNWYHHANVSGLSLTVVIMQSAIAVLNLISLFRKMKIVVYRGEDEQDYLYSIPDLDVFRDEVSEPRDSMASEV
ncbi:hypothetical protein Forpe1208_v005830 [Fusarium oxysporum f. sp. rapae]|uniref:Uncharacterized protein n=1 Tax=Fusarium oxysporum f. sp. rapae TaxID=485398 RepID=A0A8J5PAW2_FUSOX|nr:hypothetical protein Forpe1208_v005830 [Fusarium oxysporum f. sp. rapae]